MPEKSTYEKIVDTLHGWQQATSPWNLISPTDVAGMAPGGGIVQALEPFQKGTQKTAAARQAFSEGRYGDALMSYGSGLLDTAGAGVSAVPEVGGIFGLGAKMAAAMGPGIKAFHGSPHDFDKFSLDKIGTGEGAQAYGHGLYFAENEGTARSYRDALAPKNSNVNSTLARHNGDFAAAIEETKQRIAHYEGMEPSDRRDGLLNINRLKLSELESQAAGNAPNPGHMYEVNIAADPEHFLDWDKPLSEQSPFVQEALRKGPGDPSWAGEKDYFQRFPSDLDKFGGYRGSEAYTRLAGDQTGQDMASGTLAKAGIPGIKYLDQGSRAAGDGSRNYVVFDDKLISIARKYGWVPGMAIPAAAMLEYQQQGGNQQAPQT